MEVRQYLNLLICLLLLSACSKGFAPSEGVFSKELASQVPGDPTTPVPPSPPSPPTPPQNPELPMCYTKPAVQKPDLYHCDTGAAATLNEYNLSVSNLSVGAYNANSLSAHFLNPAGTVIQNNQWGVSSQKKYIQANNYTYFALKSKYCSRDMEVTTYMRNGMVFLRLTPEGNGIFFHLNDEAPSLVIGTVEAAAEGVGFQYEAGTGKFYTLYQKNLTQAISGYNNSNTEGATFTFGVDGIEIYAKYKGQEFVRIREFKQMAPGRMAIQGPGTGYGFRDLEVKHLAQKQYLSDFDNLFLDVRDFGWREAHSTGSIAEGSRQLTIAQDVGFKVGDTVIVEIGKETGLGMRGTKGVGGSWPPLSYPTFSAMTADTSKDGGKLASVVATGQVYRAYSGVWYEQDETSNYYHSKIVPNALVTRITAVSNGGKTLTLEQAASASVTNANVYFDNAPVINWVTERELFGTVPENVRVYIPSGRFPLGDRIMLTGRNRWTIEGSGPDLTELWSPKGTPSGQVRVLNTDGSIVKNFHLFGNFGDNGYGMGTGNGYLDGVIFAQSKNGVMQDLKVTNVFMRAVGGSYSENVWAYRIQSYLTEPMRMYIQWLIVWADSVGGGCVDCQIVSKYLTAGFEAFRSRGVSFIRSVGENATFSMNTAGEFLIEDAHLTFHSMSQFANLNMSFHQNNPVINVNGNIDQNDPLLQLGGTIKNVTIIQEDYINNRNDSLPNIVINENNKNVSVIGGYIQAPNWKAPSTQDGAVGLNSDGDNTVVDGLRVVGSVNPTGYPGKNIAIKTGSIKNSIADLVGANGGSISNWRTNAQVGGSLPQRPAPSFPDAPACRSQ